MPEWRNVARGAQTVLPAMKRNDSVILFDTETTGLSDNSKIIQFSAVKYRIGDNLILKEMDSMDVYINPEEPLSETIIGLTGITDDLLASEPPESVRAPEIFEFMCTSKLWAAYNSTFDLRQLDQMAKRCNVFYLKPMVLDILPMARDIIPNSKLSNFKLETVTKYLFPEDDSIFHSAIEDVRATAKCFSYFLKAYEEYTTETQKRKLHLEWAVYWENPKASSQKRIKLCLDKAKETFGDIFWDIPKHCWSCKSTPVARKMFESADLADLESQVLAKYGRQYNASTMEELAKNMRKKKQP